MFASRVSPSPTRTSIKEANDHLQLLHSKVIELEKTVQDQAEALMRKDEQMQAKVKEITLAKDAEIRALVADLEITTERLRKLENTVHEKDAQIEYLMQRYTFAEDIAALTPSMEKLLESMKKLPCKNNVVRHSSTRPKSRSSSSRSHPPKHEKRKANAEIANSRERLDSISGASQSCTDLRIGRSFNINSNFSMSEDETENGKI